jgi:SSS family solute:Na+ symporter
VQQETGMAKLVSLLVKFGALLVIFFLPQKFAIQLQLLGGILILQTLPAIVSGIYTRWFDSRALLFGWAVGLVFGVWAASLSGFQKAIYAVHLGGTSIPGFIGLYALLLNIAAAAIATLVLRSMNAADTADATTPADYVG